MTPDQFTAALSRTRLQKHAAEWARLVLVTGWTKSATARASGVSPAAVGEACKRIEREHKRLAGVPDDWLVLTVCVPRGSREELVVRDAEEDAWRAAGLLI